MAERNCPQAIGMATSLKPSQAKNTTANSQKFLVAVLIIFSMFMLAECDLERDLCQAHASNIININLALGNDPETDFGRNDGQFISVVLSN